MFITSCSAMQQDTVKFKVSIEQDSSGLIPDTVRVTSLPDSISPLVIKETLDTGEMVVKKTIAPVKAIHINTDTTSVCSRNSVTDLTFYDTSNFILNDQCGTSESFPFLFIAKNQQISRKTIELLQKNLKPGEKMPEKLFHHDWVIGIIMISAYLYSLIRTSSRELFPDVKKYFLLRGINDPVSRDLDGIFHWQSTIQNLISFLAIGLFAYYSVIYFNIETYGISGIAIYLIILAVIISVITIRHFICTILGLITNERDVFAEYIVGIYHFYRFSSLLLLSMVLIMSYVVIIPIRTAFIIGVVLVFIMYIIRVLRLLVIFINANISIFYLILYLCALEILPVLILYQYFAGLI